MGSAGGAPGTCQALPRSVRDGNLDDLTALLAADVQMVTDSGGKAPRWSDRFIGAQNVAPVLAALVRLFHRAEATMEPHLLNGQPGVIFRDARGNVLNTWTLDIVNGRIHTIRTVNNPDKLGHVGQVGQAWATLRDAEQGHRRPQ